MFGSPRRKTSQKNAVVGEKKLHSPHERRLTLPDSPAAPVSGKLAQAGKGEKTKKTNWRNRLFGLFVVRKRNVLRRRSPPPPRKGSSREDVLVASAVQVLQEKVSRRSGCRRQKRRKDELPGPSEEEKKFISISSSAKVNETKTQDKQGHEDDVAQFSNCVSPLDDLMVSRLTDFNAILNALLEENLARLPNIGQSCYMNSSLQSLLILEDFMRDISRMEDVWRSVPEAQLMRGLMAIRDAHTSTNTQTKVYILHSFREAVPLQFRNLQQHDAHEFLTSLLEQMRSLAPRLQRAAACMGRRYTCPVEDHMVFKMENTRTCNSCGAMSTKQEEFTNLSLDLV
ncbi:hypothetical protein FQN60_016507, partial [Etheostoma spectabile]